MHSFEMNQKRRTLTNTTDLTDLPRSDLTALEAAFREAQKLEGADGHCETIDGCCATGYLADDNRFYVVGLGVNWAAALRNAAKRKRALFSVDPNLKPLPADRGYSATPRTGGGK